MKLSKSTGFKNIPEGRTILKIVSVDEKPQFDKVEVKLRNQEGLTMLQKYDTSKEGGLNAYSFLARSAMDDFSLDEVEGDDLIGRFVEADVTHTVVESTKDEDKTFTFVNIKNLKPSVGFEDEDDDEEMVEVDDEDDDLFGDD